MATAPPVTIMFVLTRWGLGGMERMTYEVARRLDAARYRPVLCCLKSANGHGGDGATYQGLSRGKWDLGVLGRLAGVVRKERPQAVFALGSGDAAFWGRLAGRLNRVPVAWWVHSMRDNVGRLNRSLLRWTDAVIALSPKHRSYLEGRFHIPSDKVVVVPNGIDWSEFQSLGRRCRLRASLGLTPANEVIGAVGGLRPVKGYDLLLRAASELLLRRPLARFVIVGDGDQRASLEHLAASFGIGDKVLFLGARPDVPDLLAAFDIFAISSRSEAFPLSALQAMAAGLPVVATDVGCLSEIVESGETGILVPSDQPPALAAALEFLLQRSSLAMEMGRRGSQLVRQRFPIERSVAEFQSLTDRLIG